VKNEYGFVRGFSKWEASLLSKKNDNLVTAHLL